MSDLEIWTVIGVLCVATALARSSLWLVGHRITIPRRVQEILRFAPACALAAIIAPDILMTADGQLQTSLANPKLLAGIAATVFYLFRKNMVLTIIFGMLVFTGLRLTLPA
jgi:branched-subunit amino acid transport protein